jgi:hypothetical protein
MHTALQKNILNQLEDPHQLEVLYRQDKVAFRKAFASLDQEISHSAAARFWKERLAWDAEGFNFLPSGDLLFVAIAVLTSGIIVKLPQWMQWQEDIFIMKNFSFIFFEMLLVYFVWKEKMKLKWGMWLAAAFVIAAVFINWLPLDSSHDLLILSCIHLPVVMWSMVGIAFTGELSSGPRKRIEFLKFNGDMIVMCAVLALAGGLFSALTFGLFELIGVNIQPFFEHYLVVWGLPAIPLLAAVVVRQIPELVGRVSPLVAKIFSPIVFVTLLVFLISMLISGKDPYNDRDFLLVINAMLLGVMAIILFSLSEFTSRSGNFWSLTILAGLAILAVVINGIALSAIIYRLSLYGLSPNRLAVLGSNVLIIINLIVVGVQLIALLAGKKEKNAVEQSISSFLPIYIIWAAVVAFVFPFIFEPTIL